MDKCVIFGAGITGKRVWHKLKEQYDILAYTDNDPKLWGDELHGVQVMPPCQLKGQGDLKVIICSDYYVEIAAQLANMGIHDIFIVEPTGYMLYTYSEKKMLMPVEFPCKATPISKGRDNLLKNILFFQQNPCIRTHKIASILKGKSINVYLAYTGEHPVYQHAAFLNIYTNIYAIYSMHGLIDFVNQSNFDLVHCSNEPDFLTNLLLLTNKKIIHDTHDFMSLAYSFNMDVLAMEYIANVKSHGNLYVNENNRQIALERFQIEEEKTFVFENMILEEYRPREYLPKLSEVDGELHCVYEGGISPDKGFYRYFEDIWIKLADAGVHVHFYTQQSETYCQQLDQKHRNIHYEGNLDVFNLITEMTQYDVGLLLFNVEPQYRVIVETALPNKIFDYLAAGIPLAVGEIESYRSFVDQYKVGSYLNVEEDIQKQLWQTTAFRVEPDFLYKNGFTMNARADELIAFYNKIFQAKENAEK